MVELIRASNIFCSLFPNFPEEFSTSFIQYLGTFEKADDSFRSVLDNEILSEIIKTNLGKSSPYINRCIDKIGMELKKVISYSVDKKNQFSELINILSCLKSVPFVPKIVVEFSKRATVFASSIQESFTLPIRRIFVANFKNYRPCGNIFTSIFIHAFLNAPSKIDDFNNLIKTLIQRYKDEFEAIIIEQNKRFPPSETSYVPPDPSVVKEFFKCDPLDEFHLYTSINSSDNWPDFKLISIDCKYWNVDISNVDEAEYKNVYLCKIIKSDPNVLKQLESKSNLSKFLDDFAKEFNKKLQENNIISCKEFPNLSNTDKVDSQRGSCAWICFMNYIQKNFRSNLAKGFDQLKRQITYFFDNCPNIDIGKGSLCLAQAYEAILPSWKEKNYDCKGRI